MLPLMFLFSWPLIKNNSVTPYVLFSKQQCYPLFYFHDRRYKMTVSWTIKNNSVLFSWHPIKNNSVTPYVLFSWPPIKNDSFMTDKKQQCFIFMISNKKQQCYPLYLPLGLTQHGGTGDQTCNLSVTRHLLYLLS